MFNTIRSLLPGGTIGAASLLLAAGATGAPCPEDADGPTIIPSDALLQVEAVDASQPGVFMLRRSHAGDGVDGDIHVWRGDDGIRWLLTEDAPGRFRAVPSSPAASTDAVRVRAVPTRRVVFQPGAKVRQVRTIVLDNGEHKVELTTEGDAVRSLRVDGVDVDPERATIDDDSIVIRDSRGNTLIDMTMPGGDMGDVRFDTDIKRIQPGENEIAILRDLPLLNVGAPRVFIGITMDRVSDDLAAHLGIDPDHATLIREVREGLPADRAGIKAFDVVVGVGSEHEAGMGAVREAVQAVEPGDEITLTLIHRGEQRTVRVRAEKFDPQDTRMRWEMAPSAPAAPNARRAPTAETDRARVLHDDMMRRLQEHLSANPEALNRLERLEIDPRLGEDGVLRLEPRLFGKIEGGERGDAKTQPFFFVEKDLDLDKNNADLDKALDALRNRIDGRSDELDQRMDRLERMLERLVEAQERNARRGNAS